MISNREEAIERLKKAADSLNEGDGLPISSMIEAVVGPGYDQELKTLVHSALIGNIKRMSLEEIAEGIMALEMWRIKQC